MRILDRLKTEHPRLMVDDFSKIKVKINSNNYVRNMYEKVVKDVEKYLISPPILHTDNLAIWALQTEVFKLALVFLVSERPEIKERIYSELVGGVHDMLHSLGEITPILTVASMAQTVAIAYDWLYKFWTEEERKEITHIIVDHILSSTQKDFENNAEWITDLHNIQNIGNSGAIMAAIAVGDEAPEIAEDVLQKTIFQSFNLDYYRPSGVYPEGLHYWNYGTYNVILAIASMQSGLGEDFGFSQKSGMENTGLFSIVVTGPCRGNQLKFGDTNPIMDRRIYNQPAMIWMGNYYNRPEYIWWERKVTELGEEFRFPDRVMSIIWYDEEKDIYKDTTPDFSLVNVLEGDNSLLREIEAFASIVTIRDKWEDNSSSWIGLKTGGNPTHHGGLDLGSFMVVLNGEDYACDLGWEDYGKEGMFEGLDASARRWQYYRNRAEGHNTLVINPDDSIDQQVPCFAKVEKYNSNDIYSFAITDLTSAYKNIKSVKRGINLLHNKNVVIVQDEIASNVVNEIYWFMHTRAEITLSNDKRQVTLTKNNKPIYAKILTDDEDIVFGIMDAKPLETSPIPPNENSSNDDVKKIYINTRKSNIGISIAFSMNENEFDKIVSLSDW